MALLIAKEEEFERRTQEAEAKVRVHLPVHARQTLMSATECASSFALAASRKPTARTLLPSDAGGEGKAARGGAQPQATRRGGEAAARAGGETEPPTDGGSHEGG